MVWKRPEWIMLTVILLFSSNTLAQTVSLNGARVSQVSANTDAGGSVTISIMDSDVPGTKPTVTCHTNGVYNFVVGKTSPQYREFLALATMSRVSKVPFNATGSTAGGPTSCPLTAFTLTP